MAKRKNPSNKNPSNKVSTRVLEAIQMHPETVEVSIGGRKMLFLLCGRGAKLAREGGHDPIPPIFKMLRELAPAVMKSGLFVDGVPSEKDFTPAAIMNVLQEFMTGEVFEELIVVVWWGFLAAQPDVELEEIEVLVTPAGLRTLASSVWPKMLSYAQDLDESDKAADEDSDDDDSGGPEGN